MELDSYEDCQQPRCASCGTVMQTGRHGFICRWCRIVTVPSTPSNPVAGS